MGLLSEILGALASAKLPDIKVLKGETTEQAGLRIGMQVLPLLLKGLPDIFSAKLLDAAQIIIGKDLDVDKFSAGELLRVLLPFLFGFMRRSWDGAASVTSSVAGGAMKSTEGSGAQ